uniref:Uncharacterized protein n=1 Tax=Arundo donax TaxID=35708 RepID=A0A0A9FRZ5_ARUDO
MEANFRLGLKKSPRMSHVKSTGLRHRPRSLVAHKGCAPLCKGGVRVRGFSRPA